MYWLFYLFLPFTLLAAIENPAIYYCVNVLTGQCVEDAAGWEITFDASGRVATISRQSWEIAAEIGYFPDATLVTTLEYSIRYCHDGHRIGAIEFSGMRIVFEWKGDEMQSMEVFDSLGQLVLRSGTFDNTIVAKRVVGSAPDRFSIDLPISCLPKGPTDLHGVHCKGQLGGAEIDCIVSCGFWQNLNLEVNEIDSGTLDLMSHLADLTPAGRQTFGLFTFQNGIWTPFPVFLVTCLSIAKKIPEGTLLIGLHNRTHGLMHDLKRLFEEISSEETDAVIQTRQFLSCLGDQVSRISPELLWGHILHSEGGILAKRAIEKMTAEQQEALKKQLYLLTFGSVIPIPADYAADVLNVYSSGDYVGAVNRLIRFGGRQLLHSHLAKCNINIIPSAAKWNEREIFLFDHAFLGRTYSLALDNQLQEWREELSLYDGRR